MLSIPDGTEKNGAKHSFLKKMHHVGCCIFSLRFLVDHLEGNWDIHHNFPCVDTVRLLSMPKRILKTKNKANSTMEINHGG